MLGEVVGRGISGVVRRAVYCATGATVAVKVITVGGDDEARRRIVTELEVCCGARIGAPAAQSAKA